MSTAELLPAAQPQPFELEISPQRFAMVAKNRLAITEFITGQLKDGTDFGKIPGCGDKPTLLQPGAQKICTLMNVYPDTEISETDLGNGHREYRAKTRLRFIGNDVVVATGNGLCSTMESKYKYRGTSSEDTGKPVPHNYWDTRKKDAAKAQEMLGGKGFKAVKNDETGAWSIHKSTGEKQENPDIADVYNTCMKMGAKRSLIAATLNLSGGWSEHFTQDLEDLKGINFGIQEDTAKQREKTMQAAIDGALKKLHKDVVKEIYGGVLAANGLKSIKEGTDSQFQKMLQEFSEDVAFKVKEGDDLAATDARNEADAAQNQ